MNDPSNAERAEQAKNIFTPNYRPAPLVLERGEGVYVFDIEGKRYLDLVGGIAVSVLGHAHPALVAAIREQAGKILHTSNLYLNRPSIELAEKLRARTFGQRIFFCNSGAEANEAQIKLARRYAFDRGEKKRTKIISFEHSFHGRTLGALAATGQPKYHEGFGPMPADFVHLPYGDAVSLERAVDDATAAILVEPIQGEGGVRVPPPGFLATCRKLADERGALLLFDEVQVGVGRTGSLFAYEQEKVVPDVLSVAKGIGGGLPLGAILAREEVGTHLAFGTHATTFGGNPVACAAGLVVIDTLTSNNFLSRVSEMGHMLSRGLTEIGERHGGVFKTVRGRGLLIGAELASGLGFDAKSIVEACRAHGVLTHIAGADVLRLAPPLILGEREAREGLDAIDRAIGALRNKG